VHSRMHFVRVSAFPSLSSGRNRLAGSRVIARYGVIRARGDIYCTPASASDRVTPASVLRAREDEKRASERIIHEARVRQRGGARTAYPLAEYANIIHEFRVRDECFVPIDIPRERSSLLPRLFSLSLSLSLALSLSFSFSPRRQSAEHVRE